MGAIPAFAAALAASAILSLGMVLQKRHVAFIGHKGKHDAAWRRDLVGWLAGFTLVNLAPPFNYVALLGLPANVVAGVSGSTVAFAALFSALILGERLSLRTLALTLALFGGIALAGLRGGATGGEAALPLVWLFFLIPALALVIVLAFRARERSQALAVAIGAVAGALGGFMLIPLKLLSALDPTVQAWLASPWPWLYLAAGASSLSIIQLAYKDGVLNRVGPAFYGMQVLWPAVASLFVFALPFDLPQWIAFAVIALCVGLIAGSEEVAK